MEGVLEFGERPELRVCRSSGDLKSLIEGSGGVSEKGEFVLLLDYDAGLAKRMLPAFMSARLRVADGIARSRSVQMEMLLFVCGTMNIGKALREHGVKDAGKFLVFSTSSAAFRRFASKNGIEVIRKVRLEFDEDAAGDVALAELSGG
jgi:Kinase binding protein CGI-121